ncbi:MAG: ABC transporter permease [SAR324 cluster bacterium]|nr:ABC transporter permease [SAR324 cluster bacterium]
MSESLATEHTATYHETDDTLSRQIVRGVLNSKEATFWLTVGLIILSIALLAPWIAPQDPYDLMVLDIMDSRMPPGTKNFDESLTYWLGTDGQGRDMLSAIMYGLRTSISVGVMAGVIALILGMILGLTGSYFGGWVDALIMRTVDLMLGFPTILVALILLSVLGQGVDKVIMALVAVQWANYARVVRSAALVEREKEYIEAATCLGLGHWRILFKHLLPNCLPPVIVIGTVQVAHAISAEATLSFLGLGVPITEPSLGLLIANGYQLLLSGMYWISFFPGVVLLLTIFSINIVGDRIREILNPRLLQEGEN